MFSLICLVFRRLQVNDFYLFLVRLQKSILNIAVIEYNRPYNIDYRTLNIPSLMHSRIIQNYQYIVECSCEIFKEIVRKNYVNTLMQQSQGRLSVENKLITSENKYIIAVEKRGG